MLILGKQRFNSFLIATTALVVLLTNCSDIYPQLSLTPTIIELKAYPGGLKTFTLSVKNNGSDPLACTVRLSSLKVFGGIPSEVDEAPRSCKGWIAAQPETFNLDPQNSQKLICRLTVPEKVVGGYYAIVSCKGVPKTVSEPGTVESGHRASINFSFRVMQVVMLTVPGPNLQAIINAEKPMIAQGEGGNSNGNLYPGSIQIMFRLREGKSHRPEAGISL